MSFTRKGIISQAIREARDQGYTDEATAETILDALAEHELRLVGKPPQGIQKLLHCCGPLEAWEWTQLGDGRGGVVLTTPGPGDMVAICEQTPAQMRELARRLLNVAADIEKRS